MSINKVPVSTSTSIVGVVLDHLFRRKNLRYIAKIEDFWVPLTEAHKYAKLNFIEGVPDQDSTKMQQVIELLPRRRLALDVGANIGTTATVLANHFETVQAFEPAPDLYEALKRNLIKYPDAQAKLMVVGEEIGETYLTLYTKFGQLSHVESGHLATKKYHKVGPIKQVTIDSLKLNNVDFIKIDVEGFEGPVVYGARETLLRCKPAVLVEQAGNEEKNFGRPVNEASAFLESLGMIRHPNSPRKMHKDRLYIFPNKT